MHIQLVFTLLSLACVGAAFDFPVKPSPPADDPPVFIVELYTDLQKCSGDPYEIVGMTTNECKRPGLPGCQMFVCESESSTPAMLNCGKNVYGNCSLAFLPPHCDSGTKMHCGKALKPEKNQLMLSSYWDTFCTQHDTDGLMNVGCVPGPAKQSRSISCNSTHWTLSVCPSSDCSGSCVTMTGANGDCVRYAGSSVIGYCGN